MGRYDRFETDAATWLTETVDVYAAKTQLGMGGAMTEEGQKVITDLKASVQPRAAYAQHTLLGWLPDQTHTLYCKALDEQRQPLDIKLGYVVKDVNDGRCWQVISPPELFIDPETKYGHHYEVALRVQMVGAR